jgi:hypothetical protein
MLANRRAESSHGGYLDAPDLEKYLQAEVYFRQGPAVFKAHGTGPLVSEWIRTGKAKAVCTFRDPRDCVASDVAFMNAGFDNSVQRVATSLKALGCYQDFGRTLFVRYEEMMNNRLAQIQLIAAHLNIRIDQKELEWIDQQTNIDSSRKLCGQITALGEAQSDVVDGAHRRHVKTLLHDNHIGTAKIGRWKQDLTDAQGQQVTLLFAGLLLMLGYETQRSIEPYLMESDSAAQNVGHPAFNDSADHQLRA